MKCDLPNKIFPKLFPPIRFTEPILRPSGILTWEGRNIHSNFVVKNEEKILIYYNGPRIRWGGIGVAYSLNGRLFVKYRDNPILKPDKNEEALWKCCVLKMGSKDYRMWYGVFKKGKGYVNYAYSSDGLMWSKYTSNPILTPGNAGAFDAEGVYTFRVMYDRSTDKFIGVYGSKYGLIGLAISMDGITWRKFDENPILKPISNTWEEGEIFPMYITKFNDTYVLFYEGNEKFGSLNWKIGIAYSLDLKNWKRDPRNPIFSPCIGNFDEKSVSDPTPIIAQDRIYLYYGAFDKLNKGSVGLAVIPLEKEITDYFMSTYGIWNNIEVKEDTYSIGIVCPLYKKVINLKSKMPGNLKVEVKFKGDERYKIFDIIPVKETCEYTLPSNVYAFRISYDRTAKISALCRYVATHISGIEPHDIKQNE
ncbi:MAG: hypothetical protein LM601_10055 [Candidatus Verstraetearchaeota archaeon]|nr:hypothetical protein [Candidatus Verstraetearchaeota archaeon]